MKIPESKATARARRKVASLKKALAKADVAWGNCRRRDAARAGLVPGARVRVMFLPYTEPQSVTRLVLHSLDPEFHPLGVIRIRGIRRGVIDHLTLEHLHSVAPGKGRWPKGGPVRKSSLMIAAALSLLAAPQAALESIAAEPAWSKPPLGGGKSDLHGLRRKTLKRAARSKAKRPQARASRRRNRR